LKFNIVSKIFLRGTVKILTGFNLLDYAVQKLSTNTAATYFLSQSKKNNSFAKRKLRGLTVLCFATVDEHEIFTSQFKKLQAPNDIQIFLKTLQHTCQYE